MSSALPWPEVRSLAQWFGDWPAELVLRWGLERFHPRIALACSFQDEDLAVLDLAWRIQPNIRVFFLDTGRLPEETYEVLDRIQRKYGIRIRSFFPQQKAVEDLVGEKGFYSFRTSVAERQRCCAIRKVEPLGRALTGLDGWITGLRRGQGPTRARVAKVDRDGNHGGILKLNPIADWTGEQVRDYLREHQIPRHPLHDRGYPSIGCAPCTRAVLPGEDRRGGRWWWEKPDTKECGLH